jgi:hypothetical protein
MKPIIYLSFWVVLWTCGACNPETELITVPNNTAPPDYAVSLVVMENYVSKSYISLLGRKPLQPEVTAAMTLLSRNNAAPDDRKTFLQGVVQNEEFTRRMYDVARAEILANLDTTDIRDRVFVFTLLLNDPQYTDFYPLIQAEIDRLGRLREIPQALRDGLIDRGEMHRRCVDNSFYDDINMGSQNFVLSLFEYFLGRYPTESEEQAAILMVEGFDAVIFLKEGNTKSALIDIFFESEDYYEGQVVDVYRDYLFRDPNSSEMAAATIQYKMTRDFRALLVSILASDEYLGID